MPLLAHPHLPVPLCEMSTVIGAGGGGTQLLHLLPGAPEYRLSEVDGVPQLRSVRSPVSSGDDLPPELLRRVLPPRRHQVTLVRQLRTSITLEA